jgi:ADP-heptose:LPS heptosyltransferase
LLLWLNGIPVRIGYQNQLSWFLSRSVPLKNEQYTAFSYHDLLQALDIQASCPELKVTLPREDIDWAEVEQKRLDTKDSGYILLYDRSSNGDSSYPLAQWQKIVGDIAQKQPNLPVVLLQDLENRSWTATMLEAFPTLKVSNPPDLGKLAAIVAGANLLVCTDSVPMQISVAVGTYTIALFGETNAAKLLPPNSERYIGIQSPTQNLSDIQPETILKQIWRG